MWVAVISVLAAGASLAAGAPPSSPSVRHVLILHGGDLFEPSVVEQDQAVRAALRSESGSSVEFSSETLDSLRSTQPELQPRASRLPKREQRQSVPDVIIAVRGSALEFVRQRRSKLWPGIPVVFSGVPEEELSPKPEPGLVGVPMRFGIAGTIELAMELRPGTRNVVIISGTSDYDQEWLGRAERQLRNLRPGLEVRQISNQSVPQMLESVADLSADSVHVDGASRDLGSSEKITDRAENPDTRAEIAPDLELGF